MTNNYVYLWNKDGQYTIHTIIREFTENREKCNPQENAAAIAKMLLNSCPGNTFDIILDAIKNEILPMLDSQEKIDILKQKFDIENRVRVALNQLAENHHR